MLIALIVALIVVTLAHAYFGDRRDQRERAERADLLQRIQAPHAAVAEHHAANTPPVGEQDGMPMTDEQIAELQERDRIVQWMEAVENGDRSMLDDGVPH